jgi:hypothetical protein
MTPLNFGTVHVPGSRDGYLYTSLKASTVDPAHVQVVGTIEGDLLYVVIFTSDVAPVDVSFIEEILTTAFDATR